jgi:RNA polymerase sigma-70 factor (ECF subfamily)
MAFQLVKDSSNADDIVQEVFIAIWNKRDEIEINSTIEGYLVKSTANKCYTFLEKNKKIHKIELDDFTNYAPNDHKSDNYDNEVLKKLINESLEKLPAKCKTIFVLSRFEKMKNKEIAEHLDISVKTVENQMTIAIGKLNTELKPKIDNFFPELLAGFLIFLQIF